MNVETYAGAIVIGAVVLLILIHNGFKGIK